MYLSDCQVDLTDSGFFLARLKIFLFILETIHVSESAYRELPVFCDGLPRTYLDLSMPERY
jgi:hypothetical protein